MKGSKDQGKRYLPAQIRSMEGEGNERRFILSFSSEEPYKRWFGMEILSHETGAAELMRLNEIGVVLFNHNRDKVLGKIHKAWVEGLRGYAEIEFDEDAEAEVIFQKVKNETLKGVSVSYRVSVWEDVEAGAFSSDGRHQGPCNIAKKWEPTEISIVSVPADPSVGVGRELEEENEVSKLLERQLIVNKNYCI